jgi:DNA-binding response OmpR family regulator
MSLELAGCRVMVVEDEFFLAVEIEDALTRAGAEVVGPIPDVRSALGEVGHDGLALAVLDVNLGGSLVYPVADALAERGIPFLFASAYPNTEVPIRHKGRPYLEKPYETRDLIARLADLVRRGPP